MKPRDQSLNFGILLFRTPLISAKNISLCHHMSLWSPPTFLSSWYWERCFCVGVKSAGSWSWWLTSIYSPGMECVELYLHLPYTP